MAKWLTKSDYVHAFLVAPAYLWLKKHQPDRLPPIDEGLQFRFDQGHKLTELAQQKFAGGVLIAGDTLKSLDETTQALKQVQDDKEAILYEPAMLADDRLYARADIIKKNGAVWDMYEVKSATGYHRHPEYLMDLAFQKIVWERAGMKIGKLNLVLVNTHYKRNGDIEPEKLFYVADVTDAVPELIPRVEAGITEALKIIDAPSCPIMSPLDCSHLSTWLPIYEHLEGALPEESIFRLAWLTTSAAKQLDAAGIKQIRDINHPDQFNLTPAQRGQWEALLAGKPTVHTAKIHNYLSKLKFPLYFLDYETVAPAVPLWDGVKPYQTVPFQYSVQIIDTHGAEPREVRYLHKSTDNPLEAVVSHLRADIGPVGSILVWSAYESMVHNAMAAQAPEHKPFLAGLNKRLFDLMQVFQQQMYIDHRFLGSASIKKVLPVLVPELSYKDLEISEGNAASGRWQQTVTGETKGTDAQKVFTDLEVYCAQDTMAMVKIYDILQNHAAAPTQGPLPF